MLPSEHTWHGSVLVSYQGFWFFYVQGRALANTQLITRYKARSYRARIVRNPRAVLKEFGTEVPLDVAIQICDSNADTRYDFQLLLDTEFKTFLFENNYKAILPELFLILAGILLLESCLLIEVCLMILMFKVP